MKTFSFSAAVLLSLFLGMLPVLPKNSLEILAKPARTEKGHTVYKHMLTNLQGTYHGNGFYTYTQTMVLTASATPQYFVADVPNRFLIKDSSGNTVFSTDWHGDANYYGPWGASITTGASNPNTFYGTTLSAGTYTVYVDTCTNVNNGGSDDAWYIYY